MQPFTAKIRMINPDKSKNSSLASKRQWSVLEQPGVVNPPYRLQKTETTKTKSNQMSSACAAFPMLISVFQNQDFFLFQKNVFSSRQASVEEIDGS